MRSQLTKIGAALLVVALVSQVALAATVTHTANFSADAAQNPSIDTDVTKDYHEVGWDIGQYENDNGELATLNASLNTSADNPVSLVATDIEVDEFGEFPRKDAEDGNNTASALDASEWSTDAAGTAGSLAITDVTTAPNVNAVELSTSSQTSGDVAVFTYSNFSITSDAEKRYVQIAQDVDVLDSGATATLMLNDSDGDYVEIELANASADASTDTVVSNATGEGAVQQTQIGALTVMGTGDGTIGEITEAEVHIEDADATIQIAAFNAEKMGEWTFGEERYDSDGDGEKDSTRQVMNPSGTYSITGTDTLGSTFSDAAVHGLTAPMHFEASLLEGESDVEYNYTEASNYPSFEWKVDQYYRLTLPSAYDLSYSNAQLEDDVSMPGSRYQAVDLAEGIGDTDFENVSSWTSVLSNYDSEGAHRVLDSTIQPGQEIAFHAELVITDGERNAIDDVSDASAGGQFSQESGGILGTIFSLPGMLIGSIVGFLGLRRLGG